MKSFNEVLSWLFAYSAAYNALTFPSEESFKVHSGTATPEETALVEEWRDKVDNLKEATILKLTELGVENPRSTLSHFNMLYEFSVQQTSASL